MRTLRLSLIGTTILALLGGPSIAAVAQSTGDAQPALVTGSQACVETYDGTETIVNGVEQGSGWGNLCTFTQDDPRVSGSMAFDFNWECHPGGSCVGWSSDGVLTGPDGTWVGGSVEAGLDSYVGFWEGTGAYEGWVFVSTSSAGDPLMRGIIYRGDVPPWWQPTPGGSE